MDLQWEDVRYLEAIERTGTVAAASRELGLSISTLYRRVKLLEDAVGRPCLQRGPTDATVTEAGRALAQVGRKTRKSISEVLGQLRAQEQELEGEVSLTTVTALLPFVEVPLRLFTSRHPLLRATLHLGDDGPSVRDREVDVALGVMRRPPPGCWGRKLVHLTSGVFATREAASARPRRWLARALAETHSPESAWERAHVEHVSVRAPFAALVPLCAQGLGLCLMPKILAARHPDLVEVHDFDGLAPLERTVWLLTHPDQRKTPRIVALMDALAEGFIRY